MKSNQVALFGIRPLVRIMLCCCGGFLIANVLESTAVTTGIFLGIFALLLLVVLALTRVKRYTNNWQTGVFTVTAITTVAVFTSWVYNYQLHEHHSKNRKWLEVLLVSEGVLAELHCKKNANCNALFHVDRILHDSVWVNVGCRIALRIHNGSWLREGDRIVVFAPFREIRPPLNAGDFNFKSYMAQRGVFWQANIDTTQLMLLSRFHEKGFVLAARR